MARGTQRRSARACPGNGARCSSNSYFQMVLGSLPILEGSFCPAGLQTTSKTASLAGRSAIAGKSAVVDLAGSSPSTVQLMLSVTIAGLVAHEPTDTRLLLPEVTSLVASTL